MPTFYLPTEPAVWIYASCREEGEACAEEMAQRLRKYAHEHDLRVTIEVCDEYRNHDFNHSNTEESNAILHLEYFRKTVPLWEIRDKAMEAREKIREREIQEERVRAEKIRAAGLDQIAAPLGGDAPVKKKKKKLTTSAGVKPPKQANTPKPAKKAAPKTTTPDVDTKPAGSFLPVFGA